MTNKKCVASLEAPFTEKQRQRLGTVLEQTPTHTHVEWEDSSGWKTKVWMPTSWLVIDEVHS